ncbi:MAG: chromosome segregation protein SMC [Polyangia bacterium]
MRIRRLEICGFKSFVDRTILTFEDPITGVVGPNGCGKSNIVDAIRWVMGEQSAKHLRGRAMDDVIFAGSESRGPAGMAEVSLTFDTAGLPGDTTAGGVPWGAAGPAEVVVTRRLYRGGESEYLLSGVPCRLRDIVEFFLGTGVGSKAYAIIEQGRIGFIVSSRPEERRGLIDEAAGITKYKAKKKVAERRIEASRQHLLRVSDIIVEIETRLRSLRLQAQKAERYKRYRAELKDLELCTATQKHLGLVAEQKVLLGDRARKAECHAQQTTDLCVEDTAIEAERLALSEEMAELAAAKEELFAIENKAGLSAQRSESYANEAASLGQRAERSRREIEGLVEKEADDLRTLAELQGEVGRFDEEAEARNRELDATERAYAEARSALIASRHGVDQAMAAATSAATRIARLEADIESSHGRAQELAERLQTAVADDGVAVEQVERLMTEGAAVDERLAQLQTRAGELLAERAAAETRATSLREEVARGELELETLREEAHRRRSRLQSLAEIQARYESFQRGVRAIMQRVRDDGQAPTPGQDTVASHRAWSMGGVRGVVADIVQPPPELETALEAVLGERLGNIIVESHDVGVEAIEYLKSKSEGRSSFIPVELRSPAALAAAPAGTVVFDTGGGLAVEQEAPVAMPVALPSGEGVRGPMLELIGYDRRYDRVAAYLLGDVVVVEDLRSALELWRRTHTDKTLVTLDGEVIDPHGVVTGGSRESALVGVLSQKREMRELEEVVARLETDYQAALDRHVGHKQSLAEVNKTLAELITAASHNDMELLEQRKDGGQALRERRQLEARLEQLRSTADELRVALAQNEKHLSESAAALAELREASLAHENSVATLRAEAEALQARTDVLAVELSSHRVAAAQANDRRKTARENHDRLERDTADHQRRRTQLEAEVSSDLLRTQTLRAEAEQLRGEAALLKAEASERARVHGERQCAVEERSGILARREADLRETRTRVTRLAEELSALDLRCQKVALLLSSLEEQVRERHPDVLRLADILTDFHLRPLAGEKEDSRLKELRGLLDRMGEVNLMAIEESEELQKRYDFLSSQKADLESAIARLESAIEKINRASRKRFREVFDAVNAKFQEVFPHLFCGGRAALALTDENDLLETGVEIVANPPGKKVLQNIELLSGGEKALTAVALLFAIFLVRPSAFCVLDEVDAPLDEANVGRFNQAVREMTDRSQFIIVTHNQRTMEIADRLCGITMEEPGVSKLVAVNLRASRKLAPPPLPGDMAPSEPESMVRSTSS